MEACNFKRGDIIVYNSTIYGGEIVAKVDSIVWQAVHGYWRLTDTADVSYPESICRMATEHDVRKSLDNQRRIVNDAQAEYKVLATCLDELCPGGENAV